MAKQRISTERRPADCGGTCRDLAPPSGPRRVGRFFVVSLALLLFSTNLLAAQQGDSERVEYKIFPLKYISVEQGRKYLIEAGIGTTVSAFPGSPALLVTAKPDELIKVMTILNLVDGRGQFAVRKVFGASEAKNLPSIEQIAATVGNISIGSFFNPPAVNAKVRAIIDIHNGAVVVVAPVSSVDKIISAVRQLSNPGERITQSGPDALSKLKAPGLNRPDVPELHFAAPAVLLRKNEAAGGEVRTQPNGVAAVPEQEQKVPEQKEPGPKVPEPSAVSRPYEMKSITNGEDTLQLALPETLDITEFLGFVGEHLNLNYLYDPTKVKGDITLRRHGRLRGPIKLKELYPLLEQVMQFHGFAMTRRGDLVTIVPAEEAQNIDPVLYPDAKDIEIGDAVITRVFKLQHIDTTNAKNLLDGMRLVTEVRPIPETRTLIVTAFAYRMPRIEALLELVDKPGEPKRFRFRQLKYTMAQTLTPKIQTLAEQLGTISITIAAAPEVQRTTSSARKPGETTAQYQLRLRQEAQARARRTPTPSAAAAEPAKPTVYLDADERTNRVLMIGLDEQLDAVEELIDTLDVAQQDLRTLKLYKIVHVDAEEARKKLEELNIITPIQRSTYPYSSTSRITGGTQPPTPTTRTQTTTSTPTTRAQMYGEAREDIVGEPQVVVVEPTNSLLVNATAEQHVQIAMILSYVDNETDVEEIPYKIYPLENQSPDHLATILEPLVQETILDKEGKIEQVIKKQEDQITIVPDPNTFSLIVYASKKNQLWIGDLIEKLDQRRPQVLIDVTLVQISKTDAFDYDLNLIQSFPDLVATSGLTGAILPGVEAGASNLVSSLLSSGRNRFIDFQSRGGSGTGFYGDRHINALLTAMEQKDYGRVLAKPKILVNDNEPGIISATDTTYVTKTTGAVVEGSTGVVQTGVDYQGYDAGITLEIVPHISRGDLLRLDIKLTRSDFGVITGERPPDTTSNDIDTTVTVPDGSTIILGGLLKLNQSKGGTKVPLLGDIPLIGGLFRSTSNSDLQRHMYVFVKAEIIRPDNADYVQSDLKRISDRNRKAFEEYEIEFQEYHDWPGIKPKPMKPFKVLETQ
ncbi:MAG TPA: secretin N-terminal domain-containing protein [Sedimentisphaerales bacterium]|nr:secretin N-terminal domain-containing protein [Sedimentisphaerales bacterium]